MDSRRTLSTTDRAKIFETAGGVCHICSVTIQAGQRWQADHVIPRALTGRDDLAVFSPAHERCHLVKTKRDVAVIAKAERIRNKFTGAFRTRHPMPGSRASGRRKRMNGEVDTW